jgi:tRNA uridine 5-carbamoylmethylation protein Kti12
MKLIIIHGAPGVGKLTVARELSRETGYKLFHNHLTVDLVCSMFNFDSEQAIRLSDRFRLEMFEEAARAEIPGVIFTLVYASGDDDAFVQDIIDAVEPHGGVVRFVLLTCETDELLKRVGEESRLRFGKLRDPDVVSELLARYDMATPVPHKPGLVIDNTHLAANEVAYQILDYLG